MLIKFSDFNGADKLLAGPSKTEWEELSKVLTDLPLHLKGSDQKGKVGSAIFDVVGTNEHIKAGLIRKGWKAGIPIPAAYSFLGTDVDFSKRAVLGEVQFSNYPFLLNNTIRSELFFKAKVRFTGAPVGVVVIVTKAHMFPASNSTLYYEQGLQQLKELSRHSVFDAPIRLVGLFASHGAQKAIWTEYTNSRYSRTVHKRREADILIANGATSRSRASIAVL